MKRLLLGWLLAFLMVGCGGDEPTTPKNPIEPGAGGSNPPFAYDVDDMVNGADITNPNNTLDGQPFSLIGGQSSQLDNVQFEQGAELVFDLIGATYLSTYLFFITQQSSSVTTA